MKTFCIQLVFSFLMLPLFCVAQEEGYRFDHGPYLQGLTDQRVFVYFTTSEKGFSSVELRDPANGEITRTQVPKFEKDYRLVWHDEFDYSGKPDPEKWDYEEGFIRNQEPQWYQRENAWCEGGHLIIEAKKERKKNPQYDPSHAHWKKNREYAEYTSACLITLGKFEFTYGKVVMRAKIDLREGLWPAFWMLGVNRGPVPWPACGEVDIMEYYRGNMHANLAWEGQDGSVWNAQKWPIDTWGGQQWAEEFHEWTLEWDKNKMVISMDGQVLNNSDLLKTINFHRGDNPFQQPFYLLLNVALGQAGERIPEEHLPARMVVDYVRVYQR